MNYHLLGRSGLRVSPLALGAMTFGNDWGWGSSEETAREIFNAYLEAGGNFVDTADLYTNGTSERLVGKFVAERRLRDQVVIATKFSFGAAEGNPNAGGNGRKNMLRAVEGSLQRLGTDYIDLYWVHAWDTLTPAEEVMSGLNALVQSGKVRYVGLSDCPAWYGARAQTLAEWRGWERLAGLQMEYNLTERAIEHEYVPMAQELGMGICVWSPLASGLLSGKHTKESLQDGRLKSIQGSGNPVFDRIASNPRNWEIVAVLNEVAKATERSPAQVALNWVTRRPGVSATLIGASKLDQLRSNLEALDFSLPADAVARLEEVSRPELTTPYMFFGEAMQAMQRNGTTVRREPEWFRG
jgi:aryl-alcohol dehydrogenase-like predicted oxidoreductase